MRKNSISGIFSRHRDCRVKRWGWRTVYLIPELGSAVKTGLDSLAEAEGPVGNMRYSTYCFVAMAPSDKELARKRGNFHVSVENRLWLGYSK